jgi:hypothetical protein
MDKLNDMSKNNTKELSINFSLNLLWFCYGFQGRTKISFEAFG